MYSGARQNRHLQPLLLRGSLGCPRPPRIIERAKIARPPGDKTNLDGTLRRHQLLRTLSRPQRRGHPKVFPPRLEERTEEAFPRASRGLAKKLEVLHGGRQGTHFLE